MVRLKSSSPRMSEMSFNKDNPPSFVAINAADVPPGEELSFTFLLAVLRRVLLSFTILLAVLLTPSPLMGRMCRQVGELSFKFLLAVGADVPPLVWADVPPVRCIT